MFKREIGKAMRKPSAKAGGFAIKKHLFYTHNVCQEWLWALLCTKIFLALHGGGLL